MPPIKVDLDAVASGSGGNGNSIREDAFRRVLLKLLQPIVKPEFGGNFRSVRPATLNVIPNRRHDAILISARRGDGKTTFLTDVLALVQKAQESEGALRDKFKEYGEEYPDKSCSLYSLGIIDPTLVENKQNIVVIIIEKIKSAVDRHFEIVTPDADALHDDFMKTLHELASGLMLLDGIGEDAAYGKDWADPDYILETGLDRASAAGAFERAFHRFVAKACEFIKRDAFVLAIDDVDTWFERGWPVLEALRKYLATPQLKIILAGDLNLYSLLVRQRQWQQITKEFAELESKSISGPGRFGQVERMVDTLQDQYLIKIAPPENRVELKPLLSYAERNSVEFLASKSGGGSLPAAEFINKYSFRLFALISREDVNAIREVLLRLPLRSGLQALAGAWNLVSSSSAGSPDDRQTALDALRYVASTWMLSMNLDATAIRDASSERIFALLTNWMSANNLWLVMPRFQPDGSDDGRNLVAIYLAATLVDQFQANAHAMVDYWMRICTIRELFDSNVVEHPTVGALTRHLKVGTNEKTMQFVSRLASWEAGGAGGGGRQLLRAIRLSGVSVPATRLREPVSVQGELYGIEGTDSQREVLTRIFDDSNEQDNQDKIFAALAPPLRNFHEILVSKGWAYNHSESKRPGITGTLANSLKSLKAQLDPDSAAVFGLGAMHVVSAQQSENGIYSFLRIISAIGELTDLSRAGHVSEGAVEELIARLSQIRSYPAPSSVQGDLQDADPLDGESELLDMRVNAQVEDQERISHLVATWLNSFSSDEMRRMALAPVTLARIWTRFTYAFTSIRDALQHLKTRYLGVLMHRTAIAFLHSVGVESLRASGESLGPKMVDNPVESSEAFLLLLKRIDANSEPKDPVVQDAMLWFEFLFSCPIWDYFFAKTDSSISGDSSRYNATQEVYALYRKRLEKRCNITRTLRVQLNHPEENGKKIDFDTLYFALNTIQMQGLRSAGARAKSSPLAEVLQELGAVAAPAPPPRDGRRATALKRTRSVSARS